MHRLSLILVTTSIAWALPPERSQQDTDDDATVTLTTLDRAIRGDVRSFCSMRILIRGGIRELQQNDTVRLRVREDDVLGDDTLWETRFEVTRDEARAQRVDRRFDCASHFGDGDAAGGLEIYAVANVNKQSCGLVCNEDDPTTDNIAVALVDDDDSEENDESAASGDLPLGVTVNRIARDSDWYTVNFLDRSQLSVRAAHRPNGGRVDLVLFDPDGELLQAGEDEPISSAIQTQALPPGEYRVRVQPRDGDDFNFYDLGLSVVTAGCEPDAIEVQPCGNCGNRRRECDQDSDWLPFGDCVGVGECAPDDERAQACGLCGREQQTCSDECRWNRGECAGEGECVPGSQDSEMCDDDGGVRVRSCAETCMWGEYGNCDDRACAEGDDRSCYDGPEGTEGVGACVAGMQACTEGVWGDCEGEVRPSAEVCNDGVDNNCDGNQDDADPACNETREVGDACDGDDDCGDQLECLRPPAARGFLGGYCGVAGCDADCPDSSICGTVSGERYCLQPCERHSDCRADYRCAEVSPGQKACIPACQRDIDCRDEAQPICDRREGVCVAPEAQIDLDRTPDPRDMRRLPVPPRDGGMGTTDGDTVGAEVGTAEPVGCNCDLGGSGLGLWMLMLVGVRRRRDRR